MECVICPRYKVFIATMRACRHFATNVREDLSQDRGSAGFSRVLDLSVSLLALEARLTRHRDALSFNLHALYEPMVYHLKDRISGKVA